MADSITIPLNLPEFRVLKQTVNQPQRTRTVWVEARRTRARCPTCGKPTDQDVHDDYERIVQDLCCSEFKVFLRLRQRRFFCPRCPQRFRETFDSVDLKQRQTQRLQDCKPLCSLRRGGVRSPKPLAPPRSPIAF